MSDLPPQKIQNFLRPVFQEMKFILVGAILGLGAGLLQMYLFLLSSNMKKKLNLVALVLSIVALGTCLAFLLLGYFYGDQENSVLLLILTGLSVGLISANIANYRRSRNES